MCQIKRRMKLIDIIMSRFLILMSLVVCISCAGDMEEQVDFLTTFDFESGDQLWQGGVSDYPVHYEDTIYFMMSTIKVDNSSFLDASSGLNVTGDNPHGDLFYYFNRKISGLEPNKRYKLDFEFLVYAQLLEKPEVLSSEELYLKVGAVNHEPGLEKIIWHNDIDYQILNVDKGELNSEGGQDMINVGSIKHFTGEIPEVVSGNTFDLNFERETNDKGELWLLIGVDSGIKSNLTFGLEALTVYYRER